MIAEQLKGLTVPIESLKEDPKNARRHTVKNLEAIRASLERFGQRKPIVALRDGTVIAGNGTLRAAVELGWPALAVVVVDDDKATAAAYAIADNRTAELAEWDDVQLRETLLFLEHETKFDPLDFGFSAKDFDAIIKAEEPGGGQRDDYTKKIQAPIYEPKGEKPALETLVDPAKTQKLLGDIEKAKIPEDVKAFLRISAMRHNVFHYERIAEYYAHAPKAVQDLMERSALVIIDFDKAIENGFVVLSEKLAEAYKDEEG